MNTEESEYEVRQTFNILENELTRDQAEKVYQSLGKALGHEGPYDPIKFLAEQCQPRPNLEPGQADAMCISDEMKQAQKKRNDDLKSQVDATTMRHDTDIKDSRGPGVPVLFPEIDKKIYENLDAEFGRFLVKNWRKVGPGKEASNGRG